MSIFMAFKTFVVIYINMKDNKNAGVYIIKNIINGKFYIGSTSRSFVERYRYHIGYLRKNKHDNPHLQNSWNKHGELNFKFEVLEICPPHTNFIREQYYIDTLKPAYNILKNAGTLLGYKHTDITKSKIGKASKGENNHGFSGYFTFYNPSYGIFKGSFKEFNEKFKFKSNIGYKLKTKCLIKSKGWIYIGKLRCKIPRNLDEFYNDRIHNNRPKYTFYHPVYNIFIGTIAEFMRSNNIKHYNRSSIDALIIGKRKMAWGWIFIPNSNYTTENIEELYIQASKTNTKLNTKLNTKFIFSHNIKGEFKCKIGELATKFDLNVACIIRMIAGKRAHYKGWTIKSC